VNEIATPDPGASQAAADSPITPQAATTTGGGTLGFDVTFNKVDYRITVFSPDPGTKQYGFTITHAVTNPDGTTTTETVASLIYLDQDNWEIVAGLPKSLQVDTNLTVNALNVDIAKGIITKLS
jgi:hypothetical protein